MKIKKGFTLREIVGEKVIVGEGIEQVDFNRIISVNESAAYLWNALQGKTFTDEDAAKVLQEEYEVDAPTALQDVKELLNDWKEAGLLEE
jgi:hypothetical protein